MFWWKFNSIQNSYKQMNAFFCIVSRFSHSIDWDAIHALKMDWKEVALQVQIQEVLCHANHTHLKTNATSTKPVCTPEKAFIFLQLLWTLWNCTILFIFSAKSITRDCLSETAKCTNLNHCFICDGDGCNNLIGNNTMIPVAPNSAAAWTPTVVLMLLPAFYILQ